MNSYLDKDLNDVSERLKVFNELKNASVLITGATGLVGSLIIKSLVRLNENYDFNIKMYAHVRNLEKAQKIYNDTNLSNINFIVSDIREPLNINGRIDYIIHSASMTASKFFVQYPVETLDISIQGTKNILEFSKENNCKGIVYLSSMEAFGITDKNLDVVYEDDLGYIDIHKDRSCYSEGKRVSELYCSIYAHEYSLPVKIARLSQTFGAGILKGENRVFAQFARSAINNTDIVLHTKGKSIGNYCYTTDVIVGIFTILFLGNNGEAYTVVNDESNISIADMAAMVCNKFSTGAKVVFDIPESENKFGYAPDVTMKLSSKKLQQLGWNYTVSLQESYQRLIGSLKEEQLSE